jgi:hypothetical protein
VQVNHVSPLRRFGCCRRRDDCNTQQSACQIFVIDKPKRTVLAILGHFCYTRRVAKAPIPKRFPRHFWPRHSANKHRPFLRETTLELRTTRQIAALFNIPEGTLRSWRCEGIGPQFYKLPTSRTVMYDVADVESYIRQGLVVPSTRARVEECIVSL